MSSDSEPQAQLTARCPTCGGQLEIRTRRKDGKHFVGCAKYPDCRFTEPLPASIEMMRQGAKELPF